MPIHSGSEYLASSKHGRKAPCEAAKATLPPSLDPRSLLRRLTSSVEHCSSHLPRPSFSPAQFVIVCFSHCPDRHFHVPRLSYFNIKGFALCVHNLVCREWARRALGVCAYRPATPSRSWLPGLTSRRVGRALARGCQRRMKGRIAR